MHLLEEKGLKEEDLSRESGLAGGKTAEGDIDPDLAGGEGDLTGE